jgi:hypothetical protein
LSKGREEAAWFLKNRKFANDTTGGAQNKEHIVCIHVSWDLDSIIEKGGFQFKKTVMMGDPLDEMGELQRV